MRLIRPLILLFAATFTLAAAPPASRDWTTAVSIAAGGGHLYGNSEAALKLVEYVSYTCPHCAHFQQVAEAPLNTGFVRPGKVSVEIRHLVRDPIDMTAAMLANCGDPARFLGNHDAFLADQDRWMRALQRTSDAQRKRWETGLVSARMRAIAADLGFYALMAARGYARVVADRCLGDEAMLKRLAAGNVEAARLGIDSTPSFLLDGTPLAGTHDWPALETQLQARL